MGKEGKMGGCKIENTIFGASFWFILSNYVSIFDSFVFNVLKCVKIDPEKKTKGLNEKLFCKIYSAMGL